MDENTNVIIERTASRVNLQSKFPKSQLQKCQELIKEFGEEVRHIQLKRHRIEEDSCNAEGVDAITTNVDQFIAERIKRIKTLRDMELDLMQDVLRFGLPR